MILNEFFNLPQVFEKEMAEDNHGPVEAYGYVYNKRDQRVMWRKIFPSAEAAYAWAEKNNATVLSTRSAQGVAEGTEWPNFGSRYAEELAQKVFDENPNFSTKGRADELLNAAFPIMVQDLGSRKRANWYLNYDEDFPSDFVSAYGWLQDQKQEVAEAGMANNQSLKTVRPATADELRTGATASKSHQVGADGNVYYFLDPRLKQVGLLRNKQQGVAEGEPGDLEHELEKRDHQRRAQRDQEADYGPEYQAMVSRVGKLAKAGPLKTVWDPVKRVYKNVPVKESRIDLLRKILQS